MLEKYQTMMQPTTVSIERMLKATVHAAADTPHERWFQFTFGESIITLTVHVANPFLAVLKRVMSLITNPQNINDVIANPEQLVNAIKEVSIRASV
jgi:hypothetical protein